MRKQGPVNWASWIAVASLAIFVQPGGAEANVIPYYDALHVVQDWTLSWENSVAYQDLIGPTGTYHYHATNTNTGWSGSLTGATLAVTYIGDASTYSTDGKMSWTVMGTVDGTPYNGNGTALFTDVPGDTAFIFTIDAIEGTTNLNFRMTGLVEEFAPGQPVVEDSSTLGILSVNGVTAFAKADWILYPSGDDYKTPRGGYSLVSSTAITTDGILIVSEPATLALVGVGFAGLGVMRRKIVIGRRSRGGLPGAYRRDAVEHKTS